MIDFTKLKQTNTIFAVLQRLGIEVRETNGTSAIRCPNPSHEDRNPSCVIMSNNNRIECKSGACDFKGDIVDLVKTVKGLDPVEAALWIDPTCQKKAQKHEKINPATYLVEKRLLTPETIAKYKLRTEIGFHPQLQKQLDRIAIPLPTGEKYRWLNVPFDEEKGKEKNKYTTKPGTSVCVFKTAEASKKVILTAGEFDALLLNQITGYPSWSCTAGESTNLEKLKTSFDGLEKIFIVYDTDEAGIIGAQKVAAALGENRCYLVTLPSYAKDITEFFQYGNTAKDFNLLLSHAKSLDNDLLSRLREKLKVGTFLIKTGFHSIDLAIGGFRGRAAYLLAAPDKAGKTGLLLRIVINMMKLGNEKVGYIDTELGLEDFAQRLAAVDLDIPFDDVTEPMKEQCIAAFQKNLLYAGIDDPEALKIDGNLAFSKVRSKVTEFAELGAHVVVVDNLTVFSTIPDAKKMGWESLASAVTALVGDAKEKNIVLIFVIHTKESVVFSETPQGIAKLIDSENADAIFEKSITVIKRPNLADVYGGGAAKSQLSGSMILWRPYQKFSDTELNAKTRLILESFRGAKPAEIPLTFHGEKYTFTENYQPSATIEEKRQAADEYNEEVLENLDGFVDDDRAEETAQAIVKELL